MSVGSEDSLTELPLPFDISSAVSRALRITSSSGAHEDQSHQIHPASIGNHSQSLTRYEPEFCCMQEYPSLSPCYQYSRPPPPAYQCRTNDSQPGLVNINSSSSIEQFYEFSDLSQPPFYGRTQSLSYQNFYPDKEPYTPPAKRRRNTIQCCREGDYSLNDHIHDYYSDWPWTALLENKSLWRNFDEVGTEMVVTKGGRRMFPHLEVSFQNLNPSSVYSVNFEIIPCDGKRYKFIKTDWMPTGRAEKKQAQSVYVHPDSPNSGSFWMSKTVAFKMVKLTNNKMPKFKDQIILNSMQKYQPAIRLKDEKLGGTKLISFSETTFIAVTAYQNTLMTQMKIDNNPYARAFREGDQSGLYPEKKGGHYDRFRKSSSSSPLHDKKSKQSSSSLGYTTSATSIESGPTRLLSEDSSPLQLVADETLLMSNLSTSTYWADDNSMWNPNLITPNLLIDSTGSFSEPYLQQTTQVDLVSPMKDLMNSDDGFLQLSDSCILDDDDVFL